MSRRAYPKEAFTAAPAAAPPTAAPAAYGQAAYAPQAAPQQPAAAAPAQTPQFFNPQAYGAPSQPAPHAAPPTTSYGAPAAYASATTQAVAPTMAPLPQTDLSTSFQPARPAAVAPPPAASGPTGPRHAPPPTTDQTATPPSPAGTFTNPPASNPRGKRPVPASAPHGASQAPNYGDFGGGVSQPAAAAPVRKTSVNNAIAMPPPLAEWAADPAFCTSSFNQWPATPEMLDRTGLPFSVMFHPLAETGQPVPLVNFGDCPIIRCKRCRTYINPYVAFLDGGKRWKCNICYFFNDVPREYFSIVGPEGFRYDHPERVELNHSVVDFVASPEFMHRPPQPPVYFFVIDVSYTAVASGMVRATCNSILQAIKQKLAANERTRVGFLTVDSTLHFYNLRAGLSVPQMLVVPEAEAPFVPAGDLLVNLADSLPLVEQLLSSLLPNLFQEGQDSQSALGPALQCAYKLMAADGGKIMVFQSTLPSVAAGKLPDRAAASKNDPSGRQLLQPGEQFYKSLALELSKCQIGCDLFFFTPKYVDVATIGCLAKFTGGEVNHYLLLSQGAANEAARLQNDLYRTLTRNQGFEALMRVRCSKGLTVDSHHGSFFLRAQDLMTLPNVDSDKSYTLKLKISDPKNFLTAKNLARDGRYYATVQAGLLYTTFNGERRIRIITKCCPITEQVDELYRAVDERACVVAIAKLAMAKAVEEGLPKAVAAVKSACSNILARYGTVSGSPAGGSSLMLPNTLLRFPLYMLATFKNAIFRSDTPVDVRMALLRRFESLSDSEAALWLHPNLYNLAELGSDVGKPTEPFVMPPSLDLTCEKLDQRGVFLLDDGLAFLLWVGSAVEPAVLEALFGIQSLAQVDPSNSQLQLVRRENDLSQRVNNITDRLRSGRSGYTWTYAMKEKDPSARQFFAKLIQDRFPDSSSYREFVVELRNLVSQRK